METDYRVCPRCGCGRFYFETDAGLVFFRVDTDGQLIDKEGQPLESGEETEIFCTACSWSGTTAELH